MNSKLTLSIEEEVIEQAKKYAKKEGRSLSSIVEEYLKSISGKKKKKKQDNSKKESLINELCGSVKIPEGKSYDELIGDDRIKKLMNR